MENVGVNQAPVRIRLSGRVGNLGHDTFENENLIKPNRSFEMIIEKFGVNRTSAWIRQPDRVGDSGRDTFENENLIKRLLNELNDVSI